MSRDLVVSVVIPTYNRKEKLESAIKSVIAQSDEHWELLIIDDGSTDGTFKHIEKYLNSFIHYFRMSSNGGVSAARNYGIEQARTSLIAFLDSDDEWLPAKLSTQLDFLQENKNVKVVHTDEIWIRNGKRVNQMKKHQKFGGMIFDKCLPLCLISPSTVMIHRSVFLDVGLFNEKFIVCEDYDLWLPITMKYLVGYVEKPLIKKFGGHCDQLSRKYRAMDYYRVKSLNNILHSDMLTTVQRELVISQMVKKCEILLNGFIKHKKTFKTSEIDWFTQQEVLEIEEIYRVVKK